MDVLLVEAIVSLIPHFCSVDKTVAMVCIYDTLRYSTVNVSMSRIRGHNLGLIILFTLSGFNKPYHNMHGL